MTFDDLVAGDSVFVDANTFIYHFTPDPVLGPPCRMTVEANRLHGWAFAGMANRLRRHPAEVQRLTTYRHCIDQITLSRIQILAIPLPFVTTATAICRQTGLLINDALIVAMMQANGLTKLASHDTDFDRVPGLTRYAPL